LTRELIPFIDREFRSLASRQHRGCFGKSSGGYGAILHGMKYAKYRGAIANHSGDAYFDFVYWHDWPNTLNELAKHRLPKRKPGPYDALKESRRKGLDEGDDGRIRRFLNKRIGNSFPSVPRNARGCGVFRVGERCFSLLSIPWPRRRARHTSGLMANKSTCALANKLARIAWAVWVKQERYQAAGA
jgi:hypothetical protein